MSDDNDVIIAVEDEAWPSGIILRPGALSWKTDIIPVVSGYDYQNIIGKTTALCRIGNEIHATIKLKEGLDDAFNDLTNVTFGYLINDIERSSEDPKKIIKGCLRSVSIIPLSEL